MILKRKVKHLGSKSTGSFSSVMLSTLGYIFILYHRLGFEVQMKRNLEIQHTAVCEYAEYGYLSCYLSPTHIFFPCCLGNPGIG